MIETKPATPIQGHVRSLDGVRGVAVLMVFFYHALSSSLDPATSFGRWWMRGFRLGWCGVDIFFILSGFLITTILLDARGTVNYFKVFYARRVFRILPLYYLVVLVVFAFFTTQHYSFRVQIFYWLNLSNIPTAFTVTGTPPLLQMWSLAIEEQFYFVWPTVVLYLRERTLAYVCIAVVAGLFVVRNIPWVVAIGLRWPELIYRLTPFRIDTLCAGALLALIARKRPAWLDHRALLRSSFLVFGVAFVIACYAGGKGSPSALYQGKMMIRFGYTALTLSGASLLALCLAPASTTARFFSNRFLRRTGKYSYCFYLIHPYVIRLILEQWSILEVAYARMGWKTPGRNALVLSCVPFELLALYGLCALSWNFFEEPILSMKKHFRYQPRPEHYLA